MRVFFALLPPPEALVAIEAWRQLNWPQLEPSVPAANFHVTLSFIGEIEQWQIEVLHSAADKVIASAFDCSLNQIGFWSSGGIFWLGCDETPQSMAELRKNLGSSLGEAGVRVKSREFVPHVTLSRRVAELPVPPVVDPDFPVRFDSFFLMESVKDRRGVHYEPMLEWSLDSSN